MKTESMMLGDECIKYLVVDY